MSDKNTIDWAQNLGAKLVDLGSNPTVDQIDELESWIVKRVPRDKWTQAAMWLPGDLQTRMLMRAGESGY